MSRTLASQFSGHGAGWAAPTGRLVPDPEWPVPPRGWQLWAAAVPRDGSDRPSGGAASPADETRPFVAVDDAAFTMPTRPAPVVAPVAPERVDLLADERSRERRLPEGSVLGFTLAAAFVTVGVAVGGLVGGLVVLGVSVLLTAALVLVRGGADLRRVGGVRGSAALLALAVGALILGSVQEHRPVVHATTGSSGSVAHVSAATPQP